jgi:hypothetical protein
MSAPAQAVLRPLRLSWNLRNTLERPASLLSDRFCVEGAQPGEYPIDAWRPFPLEIPKGGSKTEILGRMCHAFGVAMSAEKWNLWRTVRLPLFKNDDDIGLEELGTVVRHWSQIGQDDVPCLAIAVKRRGLYCEDREAQSITVLMVLGDAACRIVTLDWSEGPLEDCVTPEWCVHAGPIMDLASGRAELLRATGSLNLEHQRMSLYTLPACLGRNLQGTPMQANYRLWKKEWAYDEPATMRSDLEGLLAEIAGMFSFEEAGDDAESHRDRSGVAAGERGFGNEEV